MSAPDLSIVIPTWNGAHLLSAHLGSVLAEAERAGSCEVVVADDASTDGTPQLLASRFDRVRVARRASNGGFSHAANDGVRATRGRIVLLLNNDMELAPGSAALLAGALREDPDLFAAVPSIRRVETGVEEAVTRLHFRRGQISTSLAPGPGEEPAYACGGAMAFRREEFLAIGGFDPLFSPFYWEDVDLSYRARKRGRRIGLVEGARADHDHGKTIGVTFSASRISRIYERNRLVFTWKNLTDPGLRRLHLLSLPPKTIWDAVAHRAFLAGLASAFRLRGAIAEARGKERAEARVSDRELLGVR